VLLDDVTAYVNQFRPSGARVVIQAPKPAAFEVRVNGIRPASGMQERIDAEIRNVFRRLVDVSKFEAPFTLRNAVLWQAVARITGDATHTITAPPDTTLPPGYIPVLKTICYIS
jgi:hypothetical protein